MNSLGTIPILAIVLIVVGVLLVLALTLLAKQKTGKAQKRKAGPSDATIYSVVKQENGKNIQVKIKKVDGGKPKTANFYNGYATYVQPGLRTLELDHMTQIIDPDSKNINLYKLQKKSDITFDVEAEKTYTLQFDAEGNYYSLAEGLPETAK